MVSSGAILKNQLSTGPTLVMPDAFDALSAKLIEAAGFEAVQCSGFSMACASGYPRETNLSYSENLELTRKIVNAVRVPVMADGEDGFGDKTKLRQTIREFIRIGVAGINLEDQVLGRWDGVKGLVPAEEMVEKIRMARAAAESEGNPDLVIIARTDALNVTSDRNAALAEACRRGRTYLEAGADLAFPTGVKTPAEARRLRAEVGRSISIAAGLPYNLESLSLKELRQLDIARISLPLLPLMAAIRGIKEALNHLVNIGDFDSLASSALVASGEDLKAIMEQ
jgi:2-methylisocitrate lyase-like PEP mutase family enzyme